MEPVLQALSFLTILAQACLAAGAVSYILPQKPKIVGKLLSLATERAAPFALLVSLFATLSSLALSAVLGLAPCNLCYFQRALMYPIPAILFFGLVRKKDLFFKYALPFVIGGLLVSLYHIYLQFSATTSLFCSSNPLLNSCNEIDFIGFGYVTIPVMSLTGFLAVGFLTFLSLGSRRKNPR